MKSLPIYGETDADLLAKQVVTAPDFGRWLVRQDEFADLTMYLDSEIDPSDCSLWSAMSTFLYVDRDLRGDSEDMGDDENEFDEAYCEFIHARTTWLTKIGSSVKHACAVVPHRTDSLNCSGALSAIDPWPSTAGVYFIMANDRIKIGKASNVADRVRSIQTSCPYDIKLIAVVNGGLDEERKFHELFKEHRLRGEWFEPARPIIDFVAHARRAAA